MKNLSLAVLALIGQSEAVKIANSPHQVSADDFANVGEEAEDIPNTEGESGDKYQQIAQVDKMMQKNGMVQPIQSLTQKPDLAYTANLAEVTHRNYFATGIVQSKTMNHIMEAGDSAFDKKEIKAPKSSIVNLSQAKNQAKSSQKKKEIANKSVAKEQKKVMKKENISKLLDQLDQAEQDEENKINYVKTHRQEYETLDDIEKFTNNKASLGEGHSLEQKKSAGKEQKKEAKFQSLAEHTKQVKTQKKQSKQKQIQQAKKSADDGIIVHENLALKNHNKHHQEQTPVSLHQDKAASSVQSLAQAKTQSKHKKGAHIKHAAAKKTQTKQVLSQQKSKKDDFDTDFEEAEEQHEQKEAADRAGRLHAAQLQKQHEETEKQIMADGLIHKDGKRFEPYTNKEVKDVEDSLVKMHTKKQKSKQDAQVMTQQTKKAKSTDGFDAAFDEEMKFAAQVKANEAAKTQHIAQVQAAEAEKKNHTQADGLVHKDGKRYDAETGVAVNENQLVKTKHHKHHHAKHQEAQSMAQEKVEAKHSHEHKLNQQKKAKAKLQKHNKVHSESKSEKTVETHEQIKNHKHHESKKVVEAQKEEQSQSLVSNKKEHKHNKKTAAKSEKKAEAKSEKKTEAKSESVQKSEKKHHKKDKVSQKKQDKPKQEEHVKKTQETEGAAEKKEEKKVEKKDATKDSEIKKEEKAEVKEKKSSKATKTEEKKEAKHHKHHQKSTHKKHHKKHVEENKKYSKGDEAMDE